MNYRITSDANALKLSREGRSEDRAKYKRETETMETNLANTKQELKKVRQELKRLQNEAAQHITDMAKKDAVIISKIAENEILSSDYDAAKEEIDEYKSKLEKVEIEVRLILLFITQGRQTLHGCFAFMGWVY